MASPFDLFRENQKTLMALLFIFAMIAFTLTEVMLKPEQNLPLLGLILGALILTFVGVAMKKPVQYAVGGALGGLLAGMIVGRFGGISSDYSDPRTRFGVIPLERVNDLVQQRRTANEFMTMAARKLGQNPQGVTFALASNSPREDVVIGELLREIGRRNGITVDNDTVQQFISERTGGDLTREDFNEVLSEVRISSAALTTYLRNELLAANTLNALFPDSGATPLQYWQYYKQLNQTQSLQTVAIPVASFADAIPDPGDETLIAFFEKFRTVPPQVGVPGFRQPRRIQLAYLEAAFLDLEAKVPPVTDADVDEYYEKNKDILYKNRTVPEGDPFSPPGSGNPNVPVLPDFNDLQESGDAPAGDKPSIPEPPADSDAPAAPQDDATPAKETPEVPPQISPEPSDNCFDEAPAETAPAAETPPATADAVPATDAVADGPLVAPKPGAGAAVSEYRELDDLLRSEIRDQLLTNRTRELQDQLGQEAIEFMSELSRKYVDLIPLEPPTADAEKKAHAAALRKFVDDTRVELKAFAAEKGLSYRETGLLSGDELVGSGDHPVGDANLGVGPQSFNAGTVAQHFFTLSAESVYEPIAASSFEPSAVFAVWKTADKEAHVPDFTDDGIREQVLEAWRIEQARPKAQARAEELVARLENAQAAWTELLADETITGETEQVQLSVRVTEPFSWYRLQSVPGQFGEMMPVPTLSEISAIDAIDDAFMDTVFNKLDVGQVDVVPNADKSVYYIVEVRNRKFAGQSDETATDGKGSLEAQFTAFLQTDLFFTDFRRPSPYPLFEQQSRNALARAWRERLYEEYEVQIPVGLLE